MTDKKETKTITGFIGQEPEIKELPDLKTKVANFSVAVKIKGQDNPQWHQCTAWGEDADKIKSLGKGVKVTLSGVEKSNSKDGKTYESLQVKTIEEHKLVKDQEIVIGNIEFKTPKKVELAELVGYRNFIDGNGNADKEVFKISAFDGIKDKLKEADLKSGDKIYITGEGKMQTYEGKDGKKSEMQYVLINFSKELQQEIKNDKKGEKLVTKASKNSTEMSM